MARRGQVALILVAALAAAQPAPAQPRPAAPGGARPERIRPETDDNLQWSAGVVQLDPLRRQGNLGAKLFGTAGGDPAMNGLYTYLAFYLSAGDGWRVFRLGDFLSYRILSETPGRVTLQVQESVMNQRTGEIGSRTRRLAVSWTAGPNAEAPASIAVARLP